MPSHNAKSASRLARSARSTHPRSKAATLATTSSVVGRFGSRSPKGVTRRQHRRQNGGLTQQERRSRSKAAKAEEKAAADAAARETSGGSSLDESADACADSDGHDLSFVLPPQHIPSEETWHAKMHSLVPGELEPDEELYDWVVVGEHGAMEDGF